MIALLPCFATLRGENLGAKSDIVMLNAMFALYAADKVKSPLEAKDLIIDALNSGKVWNFFKEYIEACKSK